MLARKRGMTPVLALAVCLAVSAGCASVGTTGPQRAPIAWGGAPVPPPTRLPPPESVGAGALLGAAGFDASAPDAPQGAGFLTVGGGAAWTRVQLPLFDAPRGRQWGWFTQGRGYDFTRHEAPPRRPNALVGVPGAGRVFLVLESASEGWRRIRWGEPDDPFGGLAWTRADLAREGRAVYTPWADAFFGAPGLVYRNPAVTHNLRAGPGTGHAVVERLSGDRFDFTVLEVSRDWMRVRVTFPPACGARDRDLLLGGGEPRRTLDGWVRWRSPERGPWIAFSPAAGDCRAVG